MSPPLASRGRLASSPGLASRRHLATDRLSAYLDDELDGRDSELVESHVVACPQCQRRLHGLRLVVSELQRVPAVDPPEELDRAIDCEVAASRRGRRDEVFRRRGRGGLQMVQGLIQLSSAMAVAVAMVAVLLTDGLSRRVGTERKGAAPSPPAAEPSADRVEVVDRVAVGGRSFVFDQGVWWQQELAPGEDGAPIPRSAAMAPAEALARAPWLRELLARGPVVLELDGSRVVVEAVPAARQSR